MLPPLNQQTKPSWKSHLGPQREGGHDKRDTRTETGADSQSHEVFQVYSFEMSCRRRPSHETAMKFYLVPLGAYFKPRRQTKGREMILREYALEALNTFRNAIPFDVISS